jgi:hypothetical protein
LGGFLPNEDPVQILDIDGLGPVTAALSSVPFATGRGELYQGASIPKRNIVLTLGLNPSWQDQTMSSLRQLLYKYFLPGFWSKLRFFSDYLPMVSINGVVESFDPNMFAKDPEVQISMLCPKPDFIEPDQILMTGVVDDGTDETVINYTGSVPTGFEMRIESSDLVTTYEGDFIISNKYLDNTERFQILSVPVNEDVRFFLNTIRTERRVETQFVDADNSLNLLGKMATNSIWLELGLGENLISVEAEVSGLNWALAYFNRYVGL